MSSKTWLNVILMAMMAAVGTACVDAGCHLLLKNPESPGLLARALSLTTMAYFAVALALAGLQAARAGLVRFAGVGDRTPGDAAAGAVAFLTFLALAVLAYDVAFPERAAEGTPLVAQSVALIVGAGLCSLLFRRLYLLMGQGNAFAAFGAHAGAVYALLSVTWLVLAWMHGAGRLAPGAATFAVAAATALALAGALLLLRSRRDLLALAGVFLFILALMPFPLLAADIQAPPAERAAPAGPRNVILITVDTMRRDLLTSLDPENGVTRRIDELAAEGTLFTRAISCSSWTKPALCSLLTGLSPEVHQALRRNSRLDDAFVTLPERLQQAGYVTHAVGQNHTCDPIFNVHQGFDYLDWFPKPFMETTLFAVGAASHFVPRQGTEFESTDEGFHLPGRNVMIGTEGITERAIEALDERKDRPLFLWVHYLDPHYPYAPPEAFLPDSELVTRHGAAFSDLLPAKAGRIAQTRGERAWIELLYRSEMRFVDAEVGRLLDALRERGLFEDALIVFTSDHGEEFWEHDDLEHGHALYQEVVAVPLIVKPPQDQSVSRQVDGWVTLADVAPTVLDGCEIAYDPATFSGHSLQPLLQGQKGDLQRPLPLISTLYGEDQYGLLIDGLKYVLCTQRGDELLFDLTTDPHEQVSLTNERPEALTKARAALEAVREEARALHEQQGAAPETEIDIPPDVEEQMRSLGYL
jgi:arylsulfatase A-like enzyme